jgi:hypothetical protein
LLVTRSSRRPGVATSTSTPFRNTLSASPSRRRRSPARHGCGHAARKPESCQVFGPTILASDLVPARGRSCAPGAVCCQEKMQDRHCERCGFAPVNPEAPVAPTNFSLPGIDPVGDSLTRHRDH